MIPEIKTAIRSHLQNPSLTAVALLMLVIGIGTNTAVFSTLHAVLLRQLPFLAPDELVMGRVTRNGRLGTNISAHDYLDYRDQSRSLASLAALTSFAFEATVTGGELPEHYEVARASANLFHTLGINPQLGRHFIPEDEQPDAQPVIMISHSFWQQRLGGDLQVVGKTVSLMGEPHTVAGVLPPGFHFIHDADLWICLRRNGPSANARRFHNWLVVGRLGQGLSIEQAQADIDGVSRHLEELYPDSNSGKGMQLDPLQAALTEGFGPQVLLLMAAVGLVLIIACANLAGLLLAKGSARRRELAVRSVLGASRARLVRDLLIESLVLAVAGGTLGIGLALFLQRVLPAVLGLDQLGISRLGVNPQMLLFALVASLLTGVLFGVIPALRITGGNLSFDLRSGTWRGGAGSGGRARRVLVVAQVALSLVLLVGSGLLVKSLLQLVRTDLGFETENLLTAGVSLSPSRYTEAEQLIPFFEGLLEEIRAIPGVEMAGMISQLPLRQRGNDIYVWHPERPPSDHSDSTTAFTRVILPGYFEAMGMPIVAGRSIGNQDREGTPPALVINQRMARDLFGDSDPVGGQVVVDMGGEEPITFNVVGVVGDARITYIGAEPYRAMYHSYYQVPRLGMQIALRTTISPSAVASALREAVWSRDREVPVEDVQSMQSVIHASVFAQRVIAVMLAVFSGIAVLLAVVGLYGVLAHSVTRRRYELGVRMALGARAVDLVRQVVGQGFVLVGIGIVAGLVAALFASRFISQLLYEVKAGDPFTYLTVSLLFVGVALIACLVPAHRATRVDPTVVLRAE